MTEKWRKYEALMIFAPEVGNDGAEELVQRAREFVLSQDGKVLKANRWGLRDLAFELKGRSKGYYLLLEFAGLPAVATELDRRLNLIDTVLKFQTIKREDQVDPADLPEEEVQEPLAAEEPAAPEAEAAPAEEAPAEEAAAHAAPAEEAPAATEEAPAAEETPAAEEAPAAADSDKDKAE
jgi:small subunit ribosomal protein S6